MVSLETNKQAWVKKQTHTQKDQRTKTTEFQKVRAPPEAAQVQLQILTPTVLSHTTRKPRREKLESHLR